MRAAAAVAQAVAIAAALAVALLGAGACSQKKIPRRGEIRAVVVPSAPGAVVGDSEMRTVAASVDLAIGALGIERREVQPMPGGVLRIVLPESQAARVPEVLERLADPKLRVRVTDR